MIRIGLTGGIATGKSTVAKILQEHGALIIEADDIAHAVIQKGKPAYEEVVAAFGPGILDLEGAIDRRKLGQIVFHHEDKRLQLNAIVHPRVREEMGQQAQIHQKRVENSDGLLIYSIPLLFESNMSHMVDISVVVYCPRDLQLKRLMARNDLSEQDALARINSQLSIEDKVKMADEVIDNSRDLAFTQEQVAMFLGKLDWHPVGSCL